MIYSSHTLGELLSIAYNEDNELALIIAARYEQEIKDQSTKNNIDEDWQGGYDEGYRDAIRKAIEELENL